MGAAVYMVPLNSSYDEGNCGGDWYCDANGICGVWSSEIDIMEANTKIFKTTWHENGNVAGHPSALDYSCIHQWAPFEVRAYFPPSGTGVNVALVQGNCRQYVSSGGGNLLGDLKHMTLVLSYWYKPLQGDMTWFDGDCGGTDCGRRVVTFSDFSVELG